MPRSADYRNHRPPERTADYRQHSSLAADGPEGLRDLVASLPAEFRYEPARIIADGKLAEHWDALTPRVTETVSGRSQTDGPTIPVDRDKTEVNRTLVTDFAERVLKGANYSVLTGYISTRTYHQHNPEAADGLDCFGGAATWAEQGKNLTYHAVHRVVAEGDLVLVRSEGEFGVPVASWDLFRVVEDKIVER